MKRYEIIKTIGENYHKENIEKGEWSYQKALGITIKGHKFLDIRFEKDNVSVLVETKPNFTKKDEKQLFSYIKLEQKYKPKNNIVAILANTDSDDIKVWKDGEILTNETKIKPIDEYIDLFDTTKINDKEKVMRATYELNGMLHSYIKEELRSQFVGTCLLALKNKLHYKSSTTKQIIAGIEEILEKLLDKDWEKRTKLTIIYNDVLDAQEVKELKDDIFIQILDFINENIIPFINDKTNQGQDLLNLFFTTFNKYTGKDDKNQAFTPSHIVHFMCKIAKIDRNSVVLDPTCGSGAFLVQAMTQALENCRTKEERENVKKHQIYGIEKEHKAYGLSVTNMLIHSDGNSNIKDKSCFERFKEGFIDGKGINVVLMNPPYNATLKDVPDDFSKTWKKQKNKNLDPTKGFYFVYETAKVVRNGMLLCLLPLACAIGSKKSKEIIKYKKKMLEENTLNAVFTLPPEMFHPGTNVNACCMVFTLGKPHPKDYETFFGYYKNDGFVKKKNLGRVDVKNQWDEREKEWISLYENRIEKPGMSVKHNIAIESHSELYKKEWLAEAYMKTDYSSLKNEDFEKTIRSYISYQVNNIKGYLEYMENCIKEKKNKKECKQISVSSWKEFKIGGSNGLFVIKLSKGDLKIDDCISGNIPLISSGDTNNGNVGFIDEDGDGKAEIFPKDTITVDMFGKAYYQPDNYFAVSHGRVNILVPKFKINKAIGLFIVTIINNEKYRFEYGRAVYSNVISDMIIKLPVIKKDNGEYEPNWQYMEDYIKSLPYGDLI